MKLTRNQLICLAVICMTLLGVVCWALYAEYDRPWKQYQKEFNKLEYRQSKIPAIPDSSEKIKQLWLQDFGQTDRCMTCHQGVNKKGFENAPQPFKSHPVNYLKDHPPETYGCVICHEGQGPALTVKAAHGDVSNWLKPILKRPYLQSACGKCHFVKQGIPRTFELAGAPVYMQGRKIFMESNCLGCHKLPGYERPDRIAPSLKYIGTKVRRSWLLQWLKNPKDYLPQTTMPRYDLSDEEAGYVADYLISRGVLQYAPAGLAGSSDKALINKGANLISEIGCLGCHKVNEKGNDFAPDFSNIGSKVNARWLYEFLKEPMAYDAGTIIPDFTLDEKDIHSITAYLMSLVNAIPVIPQPEGRASAPDNNIHMGRQLVKDLGCAGCHEMGEVVFQYNAPELVGIGDKRIDELLFTNAEGLEKSLINWLTLKVKNPGRFATDTIKTRMPDYAFDDSQAEALVTFLLSIKDNAVPAKYAKIMIHSTDPEMRGKKVFEMFNCAGCHTFQNEGGAIGPDLTGEAKKSRPEWLFAFLAKPEKIRPAYILKARMPDFNLSKEDNISLIEYLSLTVGESYPYSSYEKKEISADDIWSGEKLYQEVFACIGCHRVNGQGGEVGPSHTDLASRLKKQWIEQWLQNPQAVMPDVRMPRFKFKDWEFEALTNYLMTLGQYRFVNVKEKH